MEKRKISVIAFRLVIVLTIVAAIFPALRIGETKEQQFARERMEKFLKKHKPETKKTD